ncbi:Calcium uniporter protein [Caenorhabditis elegans]|uniref:Calcium uniporter protein n=1 Tax=Caenorhabditis elegans TaxID=6239 RepID=Q8T3C3_CAEEL|nr:Calcium uniporter protein [Caenorhabditis elegans]CCD74456.1 Calcium uniporter protein [Caenorhabditis elegans]|eukprot:NP_741948.1 Uncharacterized protein CELE_T25G12.11 [Caenorhabditis elegans]
MAIALQIIIMMIITCFLIHSAYTIGRALIPPMVTRLRRIRSRRYYFNKDIARSLDRSMEERFGIARVISDSVPAPEPIWINYK